MLMQKMPSGFRSSAANNGHPPVKTATGTQPQHDIYETLWQKNHKHCAGEAISLRGTVSQGIQEWRSGRSQKKRPDPAAFLVRRRPEQPPRPGSEAFLAYQ
ncbi:hypothetical protein AcidC75_06400 [Acidisoma sp. C75]